MRPSSRVDVFAAPEYVGAGTHACRIVSEDGRHAVDRVAVSAGHYFGGDCAIAQEWHIVEGQGAMSCEGRYFSRRSVQRGDVAHLAENDRGLIVAATRMVIELHYAFGKGPQDGPFVHV